VLYASDVMVKAKAVAKSCRPYLCLGISAGMKWLHGLGVCHNDLTTDNIMGTPIEGGVSLDRELWGGGREIRATHQVRKMYLRRCRSGMQVRNVEEKWYNEKY
jgi:hypothetical protein